MNKPDPRDQQSDDEVIADVAEAGAVETDVAEGDAVEAEAAESAANEMAPDKEAAPVDGESSDEAELSSTPNAQDEQASGEPLIETLDAADVQTAPASQSDDDAVVAPDVSDLPAAELRAAVEAVLFVATKPLTIQRLQRALPGTSSEYLEGFLNGLAVRYERENRGWELRRIAGGWQLLTRRTLYPWVRQLERKELPNRLSKSALETLAIVAYKQPITRGAIEDIRGVQCGPVLRQLMDLKLVQVTGRDDDALGRPLLYGTTDAFLSRFGLGAVGDLPRRHEFGA